METPCSGLIEACLGIRGLAQTIRGQISIIMTFRGKVVESLTLSLNFYTAKA